MNLSKIVLLVLTGGASAEFIQFTNQAEFEKLQPNVEQCNEILNLGYTISATSDGYWAVYQYEKEGTNDILLIQFMKCVDPDARYPVIFENRGDPQHPAWTIRSESTSGPDHVVLTEKPMLINVQYVNANEVTEKENERSKRLAAQIYKFFERVDCNGVSKWQTYAKNKRCINLPDYLRIMGCTLIINHGCCESIMEIWVDYNCGPGRNFLRVMNLGHGSKVITGSFRSFRQIS